jgi:hydrogenase nickel incorporation protein HypA/HybF
MHEVAIMESALEVVLRTARAQGAHTVHRIVLRIGTLSGVDPESLRFAFDVVTRNTPAAEAMLEIHTVPAAAHCAECNTEFGVSTGFIFSCPRCSRFSGDIRRGRELELARIEMS